MFQFEILIGEFSAVDWLAACAVEVCEVAALGHEFWDDAMEEGVLVSESFLVGAEGSEILGCFRGHIVVKFELYNAVFLAVVDVEEDLPFGHNYYYLSNQDPN